MADSAAIAQQLTDYDAHRVTATDALNGALAQYGVPEIRNTVSGLRTTLANTQNAYNNVDPSVTGRTQGSLVTEAQREKQVSNERAPIADQITSQGQALTDQTGKLNDAMGNATTLANNQVNDWNAGRATLQSQYDTQYTREQNAAQAARQATLDAQNAATARRGSSSAPTTAATKAAAVGHISQQLNSLKGKDGKVSEETWQGALSDAVAAGFSAQEFWQNYGQYVNRKFANTYAGYVSGYGNKYTS